MAVPAEVLREYEGTLDRYIESWSAGVDKFLGELSAQKTVGDFLNDQALWEEMAKEVEKIMLPVFRALLQAGAEAAAEELAPPVAEKAVGGMVDTALMRGLIEAEAIAFHTQWWQNLSLSLRTDLTLAIRKNIQKGLEMEDLVKDVANFFGERRAKAIATTEVTRLFAQGALLTYQQADIKEVTWRTAVDPWVCATCAPLEGQKWPIGQNPTPPQHVNCRCWLTPVVPEPPQAGVPSPATQTTGLRVEDVDFSTVRPLGGGVSETWTAMTTAGERVVVKVKAGLAQNRLRDKIPPMTDLEREYSAYLVNRRVGLVEMPDVAIGDVAAGTPVTSFGSDTVGVQSFVENSTVLKHIGRGRYEDYAETRDIGFFDAIIGNADRHAGNAMVTNDGRLVAIDHGLAFPEANDLVYGNYQALRTMGLQSITPEHRLVIDKLLAAEAEIHAELDPLIGETAVNGMFYRIRLMGVSDMYLGAP